MDREIEEERARAAAETRREGNSGSNYDSGHLMCRTSLWGVAGFIGCAYFAWISFQHIAGNNYDWPHDWWTATTYMVWIVLFGILVFDTRCAREQVFFGILVLNFFIGFGITLWHNISAAQVRDARIGTGVLWGVAALASLSTLGRFRGREKM